MVASKPTRSHAMRGKVCKQAHGTPPEAPFLNDVVDPSGRDSFCALFIRDDFRETSDGINLPGDRLFWLAKVVDVCLDSCTWFAFGKLAWPGFVTGL
mmetsp:Transcript_2613/g.5512  ORF Transcript_2613/g.5512 Transcript_2613/m.5512 type:complete len:97 (+) Transcript_2613:348-638(+)